MLHNHVGDPQGSRRGWGRLAALGLVLLAGACYPGDGPNNVQDLDVVLTLHDEDANFGSFQTFAMPDTVVHVSNDTLDVLIPVSREHDELILDLVADNMVAAGYTRNLDPEADGADLVMLVGAIATERTEYWSYNPYWYWWGWYPVYPPGWGWTYPPGYVGSTTFEQGTIVLTLVDLNTAGTGGDLQVVWSGAVRGILADNGGGPTRITTGINQAFTQSPYLGR